MDVLTPARRSANMARIRSRDTKPEMIVRRILHAAGYRYRLHGKGLPGKPDLVVRSRRKVVFVHGCFWHQHDQENCLDGRKPKSNTVYWHSKLESNVDRDRDHVARLEADGWQVEVVWECETERPDELLDRLQAFLEAPKL